MRILQVIDRFNRGGGAEKVVLDLSLALHNKSDDIVDILSIGPPKNQDFIDEVAKVGITHQCLNTKRMNWADIPRLRNFIHDGGYDVIHVHLFPALYMVALASVGLGKSAPRLVYTEHSTSNRRRGKALFRLIDHWMYGRYNRVIGISDEVSRNLANHAQIDHIDIIPNGVNVAAIDSTHASQAMREELHIKPTDMVVTMVGRFVPGKDQTTLIESLSRLPESVHILLVGDGILRESVQYQTTRKPYSNRVHFLGLRSDVISIIKLSDIIVLSTGHEGFSISMLEAMACGKPFVASSVPGIVDIVEDNALLFQYQNTAELAQCIKHLIDDRDLYETMSRKSREFALDYDISEIATKYLEAYRK